MNFIMIGLLLREALDRVRVRLNMYLVSKYSRNVTEIGALETTMTKMYIQNSWGTKHPFGSNCLFWACVADVAPKWTPCRRRIMLSSFGLLIMMKKYSLATVKHLQNGGLCSLHKQTKISQQNAFFAQKPHSAGRVMVCLSVCSNWTKLFRIRRSPTQCQ